MTRKLPDYAEYIREALRDDFLDFECYIWPTGGGCEALYVAHDSHADRYLLITTDAAIPDGRPSIADLVLCLYDAKADDEPLTVITYPSDERVTNVIRTAVALLGEWDQLPRL